MSSILTDLFPAIWYAFINSPLLYRVFLYSTLAALLIIGISGCKMYKESLRFHNFFVPNIRIFVEKAYNERTLSFDVESLSETPVHINQVQIAIYNTDSKKERLFQATKHGIVNPLKKGDTSQFSFVLDSNFKEEFNFSKVIKANDFMIQAYKIIVVVHYNKINFQNIEEQRFEYLYNTYKDNEKITGSIKDVPSPLTDPKRIFKNIPYEVKQ